jgi:riboflavin synthase
MFTGLITAIGTVRAVTEVGDGKDARFSIAVPAGWPGPEGFSLGASIACSGCCLTVVDFAADEFSVEVSAESLGLTSLAHWQPGTKVNLEASLRLGAELGGHLVSGHVDGLAQVTDSVPENGSTRWRFRVPAALGRFIAAKGSIAINGVSLTVNDVRDGDSGTEFGVNIIPHTSEHTNFSTLRVGDTVNIEIDMLARYVARLKEFA